MTTTEKDKGSAVSPSKINTEVTGKRGKIWDKIDTETKEIEKAYVKLKEGEPAVLTFLEDDPEQDSFENERGEEIPVYIFRVQEDNAEKTFSVTSKRLLRNLSWISKDKGLKDRTVKIIKEGSGFETSYVVMFQ